MGRQPGSDLGLAARNPSSLAWALLRGNSTDASDTLSERHPKQRAGSARPPIPVAWPQADEAGPDR
ncbi:MAG: hypothetical protein OXP71_04780 [Candidatus Poribacteria bacterium]|nr:hypothetical protein [Candidatus Poribacteria bacterium]